LCRPLRHSGRLGGERASAANILTRLDNSRCTWESTARDVAGEL
jgi:hypothetical protein